LQQFVDRGAEAATGNLKDWGFLSKAVNDRLIFVDCPRTKENTTSTSIEDFASIFAKAFAASPVRQAM
jgi:hypothetical protein